MPTILETFNLLDSFGQLPRGWHFGEGSPSNKPILNACEDFLKFAFDLDYKEANAFPGIEGEVQLRFYKEDDTLDLTFETNETITVAVDKDDEQVFYKESIFSDEAKTILKDFIYGWNSYESLTKSTTTHERGGFRVWHSGNLPTVESQWSTLNVPRKPVNQFVSTSRDTMMTLPGHQSSIGEYRV